MSYHELLKIVLEKSPPIYVPGETINGKVILDPTATITIKELVIKIRGKAKVQFNEMETKSTSNLPSRVQKVRYVGTVVHLESVISLLKDGIWDEIDIPAGKHVYPFVYVLPFNLPSSFKGLFGEISYIIKAKLDMPFKFNKKVEKPFNIFSPPDVNVLMDYQVPFTAEKSTRFGIGPFKSKPLLLRAQLQKTCFIPGETITLSVHIRNDSNVKIVTIFSTLKQVIIWHTSRPRRRRRRTEVSVASVVHDLPDNPRTGDWQYQLMIRPAVQTTIANAGVIELVYDIEVVANVKGFHKSPRLDIPVTIGVPGPVTDLSYNYGDHSEQLQPTTTNPLTLGNPIPHENKT